MSVLQEAFGVESLPAKWRELPLATVAKERKGNKNAGMKEDNLLSLSFGNIVRKDIDGTGGLLPESFDGYQIVEPGDLVMRLTDLQNDKRSLRSGLCSERGIITSAYLALEPTSLDPQFFAYLMRAYDVAKVFYPLGGGLRQSIGFEDIRRLPIVVPPIEEQRRIANFLDDQVGRIDQAIELRNMQKALLENRLARTLEDSFGNSSQIPLWSLLRESPCYGVLVPAFVDEGVPMIRISDLDHLSEPGFEIANISHAQSAEYQRTVVETGDLLVSCVGSMGKAAIVPPMWQGANVNRAIARLLPVNQEIARILKLWVGSRNFLDQALKATGSGAAQPTLNMGDLKKFMVAIPKTRDEEESLFRASAGLDETKSKITASISGLEERKRSLITATVTGQLDVTAARPLTGPWVTITRNTSVEQPVMATGVAL